MKPSSRITAVTVGVVRHRRSRSLRQDGRDHVTHGVDDEYDVMQGEFYTTGAHGETGLQPFSYYKVVRENPEHVVFNGAVGALMGEGALEAEVGQTVRLFVGNGGPNLSSSFHQP